MSANHPAAVLPQNRPLDRPAPNLFLVGAPKCGTTSMYEYLRGHPEIFFPGDESDYWRAKEPNHLCPDLDIREKYSINDRGEYLRLYQGNGAATWCGDASPYYLGSRCAPGRIKQLSPDARILIMLRPPVDMMRSYHRDLLRIRLEHVTDFHAAIDATIEDRDRRRIRRPGRKPGYRDYGTLSNFAPQVERYQKLFGAESVKVVLLEDLVADPARTFRGVLSFLDVNTAFQPEFRVHNETPRDGIVERVTKSIYGTPLATRAIRAAFPWNARRGVLSFIRRIDREHRQPDPRDRQLWRLYAPEVQRLADVIGRNLDHWQP